MSDVERSEQARLLTRNGEIRDCSGSPVECRRATRGFGGGQPSLQMGMPSVRKFRPS